MEKVGEGTMIGKGDSLDHCRWRENEIEVKGFCRGWSTWHAVELAASAVEAEAGGDGPDKAVKTSRHWRFHECVVAWLIS